MYVVDRQTDRVDRQEGERERQSMGGVKCPRKAIIQLRAGKSLLLLLNRYLCKWAKSEQDDR